MGWVRFTGDKRSHDVLLTQKTGRKHQVNSEGRREIYVQKNQIKAEKVHSPPTSVRNYGNRYRLALRGRAVEQRDEG